MPLFTFINSPYSHIPSVYQQITFIVVYLLKWMNTNQYLMVFMFKVNHLNALVPELDVSCVHVVSFIIK